MNKKIAIVTGASSGLGREFCKLLDSDDKLNIDEIWLIARRKSRLEEVATVLEKPSKIISLDLAETTSFEALKRLFEKEQPDIKFLINSAGYGKIGPSEELSLKEDLGMIDLNCRAAVAMTKLSLPYMHEGSYIMQICSTAGFQPFQYLNVYAASKAFLYRYSRALRVELFNRKISVTAVCPYWVKDTEFIRVAEDTDPNAKKSEAKKYINHFPLASKQKGVAKRAYSMTKMRLAVSTPSIVSTIHWIVAKFIPHELMMGIWALLRRV